MASKPTSWAVAIAVGVDGLLCMGLAWATVALVAGGSWLGALVALALAFGVAAVAWALAFGERWAIPAQAGVAVLAAVGALPWHGPWGGGLVVDAVPLASTLLLAPWSHVPSRVVGEPAVDPSRVVTGRVRVGPGAADATGPAVGSGP